MANLFKLKAWVRYDGKGRLVGGGPIVQAHKPKNGDWVEIDSLICCGPNPSSTTTGNKLKAFVRYANGKVVAGSLVMQAKKPAVGKWEEIPMYKCCATPSGSFNLEQFLSRMNSCYSQVTSLIPRIVYFTDTNYQDVPTYIDNGCSDMYDNGNMYNTNLTQLYEDIKENNVDTVLSIPYTHTQDIDNSYACDYTNPPMNGYIADGTNYFGAGSQYLTNMYPGMFIIAANGVNVTEFSITGDLGSDGDATDAVYIATAHAGWTAYIKTNDDSAGTGDPSVNHIILVYGNVSGATQLYDDTGSYDDHCVQGLGPQNSTIITAVVATEAGTAALTEQEALDIANKILDVYNDATCVTPPAFRLLFDDITNANLLVGDAANVSDWNTFFDLPTNGGPFTSVVISGNEVQLSGGSNINVKAGLFFDQITYDYQALLSVIDNLGCIISVGEAAFSCCTRLTTISLPECTILNNAYISLGYGIFEYDSYLYSVNLPKVTTITSDGNSCFGTCTNLTSISLPSCVNIGTLTFSYCTNLTNVQLPVCTNLGGTVGDDYVFNTISGNTISLTIPASRMTCDGGDPDGDIVYLQNNNTVTIVTT